MVHPKLAFEFWSARRDNSAASAIRSGSSPGVSVKGIGCASYFEIVIGIPTFSIRPMVV